MATTTFTESSEAIAGDPATDDDAIMKTPEHRAGAAVRDLRSIILLVQELRMANDTADLILRDHREISYCAQWLDALAADIHKSVYKDAAE